MDGPAEINPKRIVGLEGVCDKVMQYTTKKNCQKPLFYEFVSK